MTKPSSTSGPYHFRHKFRTDLHGIRGPWIVEGPDFRMELDERTEAALLARKLNVKHHEKRTTSRRDPAKRRSSGPASSISRGARGMAERGEHARERFLTYAVKHGGLTRTEAERALAAYKKHRVIRLDHVTGDFHVKHGGFLDRETLRRAAGLE